MAAVAIQHKPDIIRRIASGEPLTSIAQSLGYASHSGIIERLGDDPDYQRAMRSGIHAKIEKREAELEVAADNVTVTRADRLLNHARWWAGKLDPERFGDKQQIDLRSTHVELVEFILPGVAPSQQIEGQSGPTTHNGHYVKCVNETVAVAPEGAQPERDAERDAGQK